MLCAVGLPSHVCAVDGEEGRALLWRGITEGALAGFGGDCAAGLGAPKDPGAFMAFPAVAVPWRGCPFLLGVSQAHTWSLSTPRMAVLRHILLLQRDVLSAAKFYHFGLGLPVKVLTERWAELQAGSAVIALKAVEG